MSKASRSQGATCLLDLLSDDEVSLITSHVADVYEPRHLVAFSATNHRIHSLVQPAVESVKRMNVQVAIVSNKTAANDKRADAAAAILTSSPMPRRAKLMAAAAVSNLASSSHEHGARNRSTLAEEGVIAPLVALFVDRAPLEDEILAAALANLALASPQNRADIVKAGALAPLIAMLAKGTPSARHAAAATIGNLAVHDRDNKMAIMRAGGLGPLMALMTSASVPQTRRTAAEVLRTLARAPPVHQMLEQMGCPRKVPRVVPVAATPQVPEDPKKVAAALSSFIGVASMAHLGGPVPAAAPPGAPVALGSIVAELTGAGLLSNR